MKRIQAAKQFIIKYKHGAVLAYFFIYMIWFTYLEKHVTKFTPIHTKLDDMIPFCEVFIIPYFLWFLYIAVTVSYFLLTSKQDFLKCCAYLFTGMTICLLIYTVWPNGHYLRVDLDSLEGTIYLFGCCQEFMPLIQLPIFPSIHVLKIRGCNDRP
jgi:hypothetical protein